MMMRNLFLFPHLPYFFQQVFGMAVCEQQKFTGFMILNFSVNLKNYAVSADWVISSISLKILAFPLSSKIP